MFLANEATTSAKRNKREEQYIALGMTKNTMKGTEKVLIQKTEKEEESGSAQKRRKSDVEQCKRTRLRIQG